MKACCADECGADAVLGAGWLRLYLTLGVVEE
jgi:hypothetical protein